MGYNQNDWIPGPDIAVVDGAPVLLGYGYHCGKVNPPEFQESPRMSEQDFAQVLEAAQAQPPQAWLQAHPAPLQAWLQALSPLDRECCRMGCAVYIPKAKKT